MKKLIFILMTIVVLLSACSTKNNTKTSSETSTKEIVEQGVVTALTSNIIFAKIGDEETQFKRDDKEYAVGDEIIVTSLIKDGNEEVIKIEKVTKTAETEGNVSSGKEPVDEEEVINPTTEENPSSVEEKPADSGEKPSNSNNVISSVGVYYGLADNRTIEIEVDGEANTYSFGAELAAKIEKIEELSAVNFTYYEKNGKFVLVNID